MKYIILNKWKLQGAKPHYYLKEVVEGLDLANKKLNAYQTIETDKNDNFYIIPFDESTFLLDKEVS
jgi:hypothetical protein